MTGSEKIKTTGNKTKQNKVQYNLDKQTAKILALSPGNVGKYRFQTGEDDVPEKELIKKPTTIKISKYSPLGSELKKQTDISKKQRQEFDKAHGFDKALMNEKCDNSDLVYNNFNFNKFNITDEMKSLISFLMTQNTRSFKGFPKK